MAINWLTSRKNSILFQVTVFFTIIFFIINAIIIIQFLIDNHINKVVHVKRYMDATKIVFDSRFEKLNINQTNKKLSTLHVKLSDIDIDVLKSRSKKITKDDISPIEVFIYNKQRYIHPRPPKMRNNGNKYRNIGLPPFNKIKREQIVFIDLMDENSIKYFWLVVLITIDILLGWFYYFLYKKLKPLINLKDEIVKFSNGDLNINTKISGKDEIAQVSNEFNNAILKIKELDCSRKLFLRNILHELKTPITKGKLISDTLDESRKKEILQKAFLRLEYLLGEFVKLEELTSGKRNLLKKEYRVIDLLDQALDILLIDKSQVDIFSNITKINVDFELFSIALKNLIDNSMKYNTNGNPEIFIKEDSLLIKNVGKPLKKPFDEYLKPFNREYESIDKGLGLGLYITNSVIESHGFKLFYFYNKGYHLFKIQFTGFE